MEPLPRDDSGPISGTPVGDPLTAFRLYFSPRLTENQEMRTSILVFLIPTFVLACSATGGSGSLFDGGDASGSSGGLGGASAASSGDGLGGSIFPASSGSGVGSGGGPPLQAEVFAHSPDTLFRLDPVTKQITTVGPFTGKDPNGMIDIALDKAGAMYGATFGGLYRIDKKTAGCTMIAPGNYPNSLSFVPEGTVDPTKEALVGYVGSTYVRIDTTTGQISNIGTLTGGYISSGDVVSVIGGGTYLTVKGGNCNDCILEVNPTTGALVKLIGPVQHPDVFGLAFWGGTAYGFDQGGVLFQIDLTNGMTIDIPFPNPPPGLIFWGAGSTTSAPVMPPK
ncbi:MAG TPA: hypothetical protein VFK91_07255 [Methyloceanibacter sp.]|nr:hypothetical protein [Methyloceanibacter sp.]